MTPVAVPANRTKIVVTLGPACAARSVMEEMVAAGMDVARINFSHGTREGDLELLVRMRAAAAAAGRPIPIMQDLQGPKLRLGGLPEGGVRLLEGTLRTLVAGMRESDGEVIPVPYAQLPEEVRRGDRLLLAGGALELEVVAVDGRRVTAKVLLGGTVRARAGLAVPGRHLAAEALTEKDRDDLALGLTHGVDLVALSFVRSAGDVQELKALIAQLLPADTDGPAVLVKIEKHEAVERFDAILDEADGVIIARGDLGIETSYSTVPLTQKMLIARCLVAGKPVVTATEMLSSMTHASRPTRAEASDVANAVLDRTDAVMLSEETALGRFPVRAVRTMAEIIGSTEAAPLDQLAPSREARGEPVPLAVAAAAVGLARHVEAAAILVTTRSGYSARAVARFRPDTPVFAATDSPRVQHTLQLSWGIEPVLVEGYTEPEQMVRASLDVLRRTYGVRPGAKVVAVSGLRRERGYDSAVRVIEV